MVRSVRVVKRLIDVAGSLLGLAITAPFFPLIAAAVYLDSPGTIFIRQRRAGQLVRASDDPSAEEGETPKFREFSMLKFRSMRPDAEELTGPVLASEDDPRVTRVGRFLRRTRIDEVPQFINVFLGEMSIVGPRPNLPEEVAQYTDWHRARMRVRPGITGLSQISGRSELTFDETCLLDIYYIENWSPSLDLKIVLKTLPFLLSARGAY